MRAVGTATGIGSGKGAGKSPKEKVEGEVKKPLTAKEEESAEEEDKRRRDENAMIGICPFFKQDRGNGRLSCEGGQIKFPDKGARREFIYGLCAHPTAYKTCRMGIALEHYYERKYRNHE